jgi:hypothetical protein
LKKSKLALGSVLDSCWANLKSIYTPLVCFCVQHLSYAFESSCYCILIIFIFK